MGLCGEAFGEADGAGGDEAAERFDCCHFWGQFGYWVRVLVGLVCRDDGIAGCDDYHKAGRRGEGFL